MEPAGLNIGNFHFSTGLYTIDSVLEGNPYKLILTLKYLFLPSLTLGLVHSGVFIRLTRSNMFETQRLDFVTAASHEQLRLLTRKMQIIFQDPYASLNPRMKIGYAVGHPLEIHGIAKGEGKKERVRKMLERVGLTPPEQFERLYPHQLSGGQRQRIALARSLILEPEFIVADEPVSMIDVSLRMAIIDLKLELRKELGLTYLFITHYLAIAKYISDKIAIMYLGKIVEMGDKNGIFTHPMHPYTQALLLAIPIPNPERKKRIIELRGEVPSAIDIPAGCCFRTRCPCPEKLCEEKEPDLIPVSSNHYVACSSAQQR